MASRDLHTSGSSWGVKVMSVPLLLFAVKLLWCKIMPNYLKSCFNITWKQAIFCVRHIFAIIHEITQNCADLKDLNKMIFFFLF